MKNILEAFERYYRSQGYAEVSVTETLRRLNHFIRYLEKRGIAHIDGITKEVVGAYQIELYQHVNKYGRPNSVTYQNMLLGAVKVFTGFLRRNDYLASDPARDIPYAKEPKKLPRSILTRSEARKIMQVPDLGSLTGYRDRTIMEVLYSTGIRRAELLDLKLCDVDCQDGFLRIMGKGRRERIVPMGRIACRYLENYIKTIRPELIRDPMNNHVFLSLIGTKISKSVVTKFIKGYAQKAKIKKTVTCHTFRHTCATLMLRNKANIRVIQELLGHAHLGTTQIYTHVSITDLKEVHKHCHPREKDKI